MGPSSLLLLILIIVFTLMMIFARLNTTEGKAVKNIFARWIAYRGSFEGMGSEKIFLAVPETVCKPLAHSLTFYTKANGRSLAPCKIHS